MSDYIHKLIAEGEHQQLDFKFEISDSRKIARTLVAFANTDGGRLLVGVKDNGAIAGVRSEEEYYMVEAAAQLYCKPEVRFQTREWNIEGKVVLEIIVPKSKDTKHKAPLKADDYKVFIRVHDQNILADRMLLNYWKMSGSGSDVSIQINQPEMILFRMLYSGTPVTMDSFIKQATISRKKAEDILLKMMLIGLIELKMTERETFFLLRDPELLSRMNAEPVYNGHIKKS
ncbi:MAG TPA: ATP-binding protein [Bacteroidales bacterium]|nr:ATP-binding protein [Bacteroidales bacterium]